MQTKIENLILVRTAATDLDLQGRFCGQLDVPLSDLGLQQLGWTLDQLSGMDIHCIYRAPCMAASQMAKAMVGAWRARQKVDACLQNIDYGLWHGRRLSDLKLTQPRVYRAWMEQPEAVCPPGGEPITRVCQRVGEFLTRLLQRNSEGRVAVIASAPVISVLAARMGLGSLNEFWEHQVPDGGWIMAGKTDFVSPNFEPIIPTAPVPHPHLMLPKPTFKAAFESGQ
jgi:broad specificity phosphatase PhoE